MHNFILGLFRFIKSTIYFIRIVCVFCILMLALYWIQNLINADWTWLNFIKPFFDALLKIANQIYSISFDIFGATFELKYLSAVIILVLSSLVLKLLSYGVSILEELYKGARFVCKKTEEAIFNKSMQAMMQLEQKKLTKYTVAISTEIKTAFSYQANNINLDEQNQYMNKFICDTLNVKPMVYNGIYMYSFNNFEKIDMVLDVLFKIMHSQAPLKYATCIQVGDNLQQLNKLVELKHFDKVTMASDTAYRYDFNEDKHYEISPVGMFQYEGKTLEVHEFKEVL